MAFGRSIHIEIIGDARSLQRALGKSTSVTSGFGKSLKGLAKELIGVAAGYAGLSAAKAAISNTESLAKSTILLTKTTGLSTEAASAWTATAQVWGVQSKAMTQSFGILSKRLLSAAEGSKSARKTFADMGLTLRDLAGLTFEQKLELVAEALKELPPGVRKTALEMQAFGRGWQTLNPILRDGAQGIEEQLAEAKKYGATFGGKTITTMKQFIAAQHESKFAIIGMQIAFTTLVAPALVKMMRLFARVVAWTRTNWPEISRVMHQVGERIAQVFRELQQRFRNTFQIIRGIVNVIGGLLHGDWSRVWLGLKQIFGGIMKGIIQDARRQFNRIVAVVRAVIGAAGAAASALGHAIYSAIIGPVRAVVGAVTAAINEVIGKIQAAVAALKSLFALQSTGPQVHGRKGARKLGHILTGRQLGGPVSEGSPYWVGERGPEVFVPHGPGAIVPSNRVATAGNMMTINVYGAVGSPEQIGAAIRKTLERNVQRGKKVVGRR
jgi:hypothetical protein